jgi:hypothetical protein
MFFFKKKMSNVVLVFIFLVSFSSHATTERITIYPLLGEIGKSDPIQNRLIKYLNIYKHDGKPFYQTNSPSTLLANKYLLLKYFELLSESNTDYLDTINDIDSTFEKISNNLDAVSVNKIVADALGSAEFIPLITELIEERGLGLSSAISSALKFILERESTKAYLVANLPMMHEHNYDVYVEFITGAVDIVLKKIEIAGAASATTVTTAMQNKFVDFVGVPLAIWETGLKVGKAGNAIFGLAALFKAEDLNNIDTFAAIFLYDYVNEFSGNIDLLKSHIEQYSVGVERNGAFSTLKVSEDKNKYRKIELNTFYDVFYYYLLINNENPIMSGFSFWDDSLVIIKSARLALDYIEKYGTGGNFSFTTQYKLKLDIVSGKLKKELDIPTFRFNPLYFMPRENEFDDDTSQKRFYHGKEFVLRNGTQVFPTKLTLTAPHAKVKQNYISSIKLDLISEHGPRSPEPSQDIVMVNLKASPQITYSVNYTNNIEEKKTSHQTRYISPFYIGYGVFDDFAYGYKKPIGASSFINFYNAGALKFSSYTYDWSFYPLFDASPEFVNYSLTNYVNKSLSKSQVVALLLEYQTSKKQWLDLTQNSVTREKLFQLIVDFYQLKKRKPQRPFILDESEWTEEGIILYQLAILNGDKTGQMNGEKNISQVEVMLISERLKELLQ